MRLSLILCKRIRHDFLPVYIKKQWRDQGSHMTSKRLRVPVQVLADGDSLPQAEDMFTSTRYTDELARNIERGVSEEDRAVWENERRRRLNLFVPNDPCAHSTESSPTLMFEPTRLFSKDIAQACMLTNVSSNYLRRRS